MCGSLAPAARRPLRGPGKPRAATCPRPRPCVSSASGSLSISPSLPGPGAADSAREGAGRGEARRGEAAPPRPAAAPPRLTRSVAAHALQVAAPARGVQRVGRLGASPASRRRCPGRSGGGAARSQTPTEAKAEPLSFSFPRTAVPLVGPPVWDSRLHSVSTPCSPRRIPLRPLASLGP